MKRILITLLFSVSILASACAPNFVRVLELDSEGQYMPFITAKTGGCMVELKTQKKEMPGLMDISYSKSNGCSVLFNSK